MSVQNKIQFDFPPIKKEDWLKAIEKELKGADISTIRTQLESSLTMEPFYMEEEEHPIELELTPSSDQIVIGEYFDLSEADGVEQLKISLAGGCDSPEFSFTELSQVEEVFRFLNLDFVFSVYQVEASKALSLSKIISKESEEAAGAILVPFNFSDDFWPTRELCLQELPEFKYGHIYHQYNEKRTEQLFHLITIFESYLHDGMIKGASLEELVDTIVIEWKTGNDFLVEACALRALQSLLANILDECGYEGGTLPYIQVRSSEDSMIDDGHLNMIRLTTQGVAAYYARVDRVVLPPANRNSGEVRNFDRRISRNIQHLLVMESMMVKRNDGLAGSYFFETVSREMAKVVWGRMEIKED